MSESFHTPDPGADRAATAFGELLRRFRLAAGLTQENLAERSGISVRAISDMERGRAAGPQHRSVEALAAGLGLDLIDGAELQAVAKAGRRRHRAFAGASQAPPSDDIAPLTVLLPAQLPADLVDFAGRTALVKYTCDWMSGDGMDGSASTPTLVVTGRGGIGKTAFALRVAHMLRECFGDGQLYVNLQGGGERPLAPSDVLARFLRSFGVDGAAIPDDDDERAALYRTVVADRRMLVVLDDARDARQIAPLLPAGRGCAVLITARARLTTPTGSRFIDLDVLDSETARELLVCLVGAQRVEREPDAVADILTCCAGLPLAIRIVGAKLAGRPGWTLRSVADRLVDQRRRLDELTVGDLAVRACFEISYASLPRPDAFRGLDPARVFRLMGLWVGWGISLPAAAALLGIPEADAEDTLEFLVDAHLLESPGPGRYEFHDLLRVYAAERANTEETHDDAQAALDRVLVWYLHTVTAADGLMSPEPCIRLDRPPQLCVPAEFAGYQEAMDWCESEIANFPAIVEFASRTDRHVLAWQLSAGLTRFFHHRHHLVDWIGTHRIALASARRSRDQYGEARILRSLGSAHMLRWRHDGALDCYQQALTLSRSIGYGYGESLALTNLGEVYKRMQRYDDAIDCYQQALDKAHADGNLYGEAAASNNLGEIYYLHDRVNEALPPLERAYALFRQIDNHYGAGISLDSMGNVYMLLGRYEEAITHLQQALDVYRGVGDRYHEAMVVLDLGIAFAALKRLDEAETHYRSALNLFQEMGDRNGHARSLRILGELLYDTGRPAAAVEHLHKALDLIDDPNDPVAREIDAILRAM